MNKAIEALRQGGLHADVCKAAAGILGGLHYHDEEPIPYFTEPFHILAEGSVMVARVAGPGQLEQEKACTTWTEAVEFVLGVYRERGDL